MFNRAQFFAVICTAFCYLPAVQADSYKILLSTAANYQTGQRLPSAAVVVLEKGEKIRLEAQLSEEKCTIKGPYKGTVKCPGLIGNLNRFTPRIRNHIANPDTIWMLDVSQSGDFCYSQKHQPSLWREDASYSEYVQLQDRETGEEVNLHWSAGEHHLAWPESQINLRDGGRYVLKRNGNINYSTLHATPRYLRHPGDKSVWMAQQGCAWQMDILLAMDRPASVLRD